MLDHGYPMLPDPNGDYRVQIRAQEPWVIAARADALGSAIEASKRATLIPPKRRGLRRWLHRLRRKEL